MSVRERVIDKGGAAGRLRMDHPLNPKPSRINDPSLPAGRRKEIDNVMKKARRDPNSDYWDKKLLEVEEKDPNRWKHSGFKKLYVEDERMPERSISRSMSPVRHRVPVRTDSRYHSPPKRPRNISPRSPSPRRMPPRRPRPPSPPSPHVHSKRKLASSSSSSSDSDYRSPVPPRHRVIRTPPYIEKEQHRRPHLDRHAPYEKMSHERAKPPSKPQMNAPSSSSASHHRRGSPKPRVTSTSDLIPHKSKPVEVALPSKPKKVKKVKEKHMPVRIKVEDEPKTTRRPRSPSSESSSSDEASSVLSALTSSTTKITLSERFGKIAQWSVDRSNMENMRITKNSSGGDIKVSIEEGIQSPDNPRPSYSPVRPAGHFPDELMTEGPQDLSWDDVRVRYNYYKDRGYLRGLGLQDYVKWEEWWYQYQEWLRRCEIWERNQINRRRKKKIPITARLH